MRHGSVDRNTEQRFRQHRGRAGKPRDIARPRGHERRIRAVRAPQTEIDQELVGSGEDHTGGFCRDQGLVMKDVDEAGLDQLRLRQRRRHPKNRLIGKENGAFGHCVDIAAEPQSGEVIEKLLAKTRAACQLLDLLRREPQVLQEFESRLEPGRHQESAPRWQLADEELEHGGFRVAMLKVGLEHVERIEIGEQRAGCGIHRMPDGNVQFAQ